MSNPSPRTLPVHHAPAADTPAGGPPRRARLARSPLEIAAPSDLFHDYVLGRYEPLTPHAGKLRSLNLLLESFALLGVETEGAELVRRIREGLGPFRTVWGIKRHHATGAIGWELYFYDFERAHDDLSIERIKSLVAPVVKVSASEPWPLPWHMFSVEIAPAHLLGGEETAAHVYVDMRCYELLGDRLTFENIYTFHDPRTEIDDILQRLRSSVRFSEAKDRLADLIPPHLFRCNRICVANKQRTDAIYFSRIPTGALSQVLTEHAWPEALSGFIADNAPDLDHLLWDAGVDFGREGGELRVYKTGVYGSF